MRLTQEIIDRINALKLTVWYEVLDELEIDAADADCVDDGEDFATFQVNVNQFITIYTDGRVTFENDDDYVWEYLERLRKSGIVNMYGAVPYIQDVFNTDRAEASEYLKYWMQHYTEISERLGKEHGNTIY